MIFRLTWDQQTDNSEDRVIWTWGLAGASAEVSELISITNTVLDTMRLAMPTTIVPYDTLQGGMQPVFSESFPDAGGPATAIASTTLYPAVGGSTAGPSEVQLAVTKMISTPRGLTPGGRHFVGPFNSTRIASGRPSADMMNTWGQYFGRVHFELAADGREPVLVRRAGEPTAAQVPIVNYRVDNAWDTQRRRGWDPDANIVVSPIGP